MVVRGVVSGNSGNYSSISTRPRPDGADPDHHRLNQPLILAPGSTPSTSPSRSATSAVAEAHARWAAGAVAAGAAARPELQELLLKFCVVGEQNVGKSSIVSRLKSGQFQERMDFTVGVETHTYSLEVDEDANRRRPVLNQYRLPSFLFEIGG